jgi:hypothetical protein
MRVDYLYFSGAVEYCREEWWHETPSDCRWLVPGCIEIVEGLK